MRPCTSRSVRGFTLIELLVTIGIIAILAAILLPAISAAMQRAQKARAQVAVKSIEAALKAYYTEYSKFPDSPTEQSWGGSSRDNADIVFVLRAIDPGSGLNRNHAKNPRKIAFVDVDEDSLDAKGNWVDSWGHSKARPGEYHQFIIAYDGDFNGEIDIPGYGKTNKTVAVFSPGPNGRYGTDPERLDDIKSW